MYKEAEQLYSWEAEEPTLIPYEFHWHDVVSGESGTRTVYAFNEESANRLVEHWNSQSLRWVYWK